MKPASSSFLLCFVLCLFAQCASLRLEASSLFISGAKPKVGSDRVFSLVAYDDGNGEDQSNSAKVQFMITNKMKATLKDELGYLPEEVEDMEPQIASVVIERNLTRPKKGMPVRWRRSYAAKAKPNIIVLSLQRLRRTVQRSYGKARDVVMEALELAEQPEIKAILRTSVAIGCVYLARRPILDVSKASWEMVSTKLEEVFSSEGLSLQPLPARRDFQSNQQRQKGWFSFLRRNSDRTNDAYSAGSDIDRTDRGRYRDRVDLNALSKAQRLGLIDRVRLNSAIFFSRFRK